MDDNEHHDTLPPAVASENIAEVHPPTNRERPAAETKPAEPRDGKPTLPGYPKVRFHPVHGRREFKDPYECAEFGQEDDKGDWRFKTAAEADSARTGAEAELTHLHNLRSKLAEIADTDQGVVRNSVQAQESIDQGNAGEPL